MSIPNLNIAFGIASRKTFAVGTKSNPDDTAKGFGKDSLTDVAPSKIDIVQGRIQEVGLPNRQMRKVKALEIGFEVTK